MGKGRPLFPVPAARGGQFGTEKVEVELVRFVPIFPHEPLGREGGKLGT